MIPDSNTPQDHPKTSKNIEIASPSYLRGKNLKRFPQTSLGLDR